MASIRERSGVWQARVSRKGFPSQVKSFKTKNEAQTWARSTEANLDRGMFVTAGDADQSTLAAILDRYAKEVSPSKRGYCDELIRIKALKRSKLAQHSVKNLTPSIVACFRDERLKKVKSGAVIRDLSLLSSVINHARREWGVTTENPCKLVRKPSPPLGRTRILTVDEECRLINELAPHGRRNAQMKSLVALAIATAMRRGELLSLTWKYIDLEAQVAYLPVTKNGRSRAVPLSKAAVSILSDMPRSGGEMVFTILPQTVAAAFHRACIRARLVDLRFHDLRHTATTRMADFLPNVIELAAVTGHLTLQMLRRYYHPDARKLAAKLG